MGLQHLMLHSRSHRRGFACCAGSRRFAVAVLAVAVQAIGALLLAAEIRCSLLLPAPPADLKPAQSSNSSMLSFNMVQMM